MKHIFSFIFSIALCSSATAQQAYTLDQLKQFAVENNYSLHSAQNAIKRSKQQQREAFTKYFPTVSATGAAVTFNKHLIDVDLNMPAALQSLLPPGISLPSNIQLIKSGVLGSVTAIQPVFMGGRIINGNRLAKVGLQASEIQLEYQEDEVELTTEQLYWQAVSLKEKQKTLRSVHDMLVQLEKEVGDMVRAGVTNRNDLLQVQLRKGEIESAQIEVDNQFSTVSQLLAQHVGKAGEAVDVVLPAELNAQIEGGAEARSSLVALPLSIKTDHQTAVSSTSQYRLLEKNVESQRLQHKMKVGENLPMIGVGASYGYNNLIDKGRGAGALFAGVTIPISDWWGGSHAIKRQKLAYEDAKEQLEDSSEKLIIHMNNAWSAVESSHKKLLIAHDAIAQADENLRLHKDYYSVGKTNMSDLLKAQEQYQSARDRYTDAYALFQTKQLEYRKATGQR